MRVDGQRFQGKRFHNAWLRSAVWVTFAASSVALAGDTAITIYSSATPGAIPAEFYRPVSGAEGMGAQPNIPGFAIVRDERELTLPAGRSVQRFVDVAAYQAAMDGLGVALGRHPLVAPDLKAGRLVVPFDFKMSSEFAYYLVYPQEAIRRRKIKAFRDWLMPLAELGPRNA